MRKTIETAAFRQDVKRMKQRGEDLTKLYTVVETQAVGRPLDPKHKPHSLLPKAATEMGMPR